MGAATVNGTGSALRFLFDITLDRPDIVRHLPVAREPRKAPVILSPEEVARMLAAAPGVKYKAALSVAYGAGLRVSEVVSLKVSDIDSARMMTLRALAQPHQVWVAVRLWRSPVAPKVRSLTLPLSLWRPPLAPWPLPMTPTRARARKPPAAPRLSASGSPQPVPGPSLVPLLVRL
jgi:integrase